MTSDISIIIPTLNEAKNIAALEPLRDQVLEVIVVDGGSSDATVQLATDYNFTIFYTDKGRGAQLNLGADKAKASTLMFLHADTSLPISFPKLITDCLAEKNTIMGAFSLQTNSSSPLLNLICAGANIRSRMLQLPYGDQAFFIRKSDFESLGKFAEIPIMEDYVFAKRAQKSGKIRTLPQTIITSSRRWRTTGIIRTTCINQLMIMGYNLGVSPGKLASFYRSGGLGRKFGGDKGTYTID